MIQRIMKQGQEKGLSYFSIIISFFTSEGRDIESEKVHKRKRRSNHEFKTITPSLLKCLLLNEKRFRLLTSQPQSVPQMQLMCVPLLLLHLLGLTHFP